MSAQPRPRIIVKHSDYLFIPSATYEPICYGCGRVMRDTGRYRQYLRGGKVVRVPICECDSVDCVNGKPVTEGSGI